MGSDATILTAIKGTNEDWARSSQEIASLDDCSALYLLERLPKILPKSSYLLYVIILVWPRATEGFNQEFR